MLATDPREMAAVVFAAALKAADPYDCILPQTERVRALFNERGLRKLVVVGFGKAVCPMAKALEDQIGDLITAGLIITKHGHSEGYRFRDLRVREAGHPVPDKDGLAATAELTVLLQSCSSDTLVACLISGGGSALLVSPHDHITMDDKQNITALLLKAGADIFELNTVRKHLSKVKGGRLAELAYPAMVVALILSDVIGDRLDVIASGPTAPDASTYAEALAVIAKYDLFSSAPPAVIKLLQDGAAGAAPETPKKDHPVFEATENIIVGSNRLALQAALAKAGELGFEARIISSDVTGEAREIGRRMACEAAELLHDQQQKKPVCLISGGETTVTVTGNGVGGRNMELALSFAQEIDGIDKITLLSAGTDGTDGPTDAAGAIVDGTTTAKAKAMGLDPETYLENNDSYTFFKKTGDVFMTGPTGTNVMDIQLIMISE